MIIFEELQPKPYAPITKRVVKGKKITFIDVEPKKRMPQKESMKKTKQTKSQQKLNCITMIFEYIKMFFDMSTIHGFNQISQEGRHITERIIWIILVVGAGYGAASLSILTLNRYRENPTVISMERDRFSWNTTFPPTTICPDAKYNPEALEKYVNENDGIKNKTLFKQFFISLAEATYLNLDSVVDYEGISGDDFVELLHKFSMPFMNRLTNSASLTHFNKFEQTFTEHGVCFSYNSQLAVYNSYNYWKNGSWKLLPETEIFYIHPLDGEVNVNVNNITKGYKIFFHGPYEVIDIASRNLHEKEALFVTIHLSALTIFTTDRTKSLTPKQRKCRFYFESNLPHFPVYSYVNCRMECRANVAKQLCGCLPHFYRKLEGEKVCDVKGLHCLSKYREKLIFLKKKCSCMANCEERVYVVDNIDRRSYYYTSNLQWGMKEYPNMRLKRDVIFGFSDFLVYIGGMAGLFLGCSVLSFIEIAYFFTLRLFWFIINYNKNN